MSIVVGITDSSASRTAVVWAATRAAATGERVRLVHVLDDVISSAHNADLVIEAQNAGRQLLGDAAARAADAAPGVPVTMELLEGDAVQSLERLSAEASVVVVGSDWSRGGRPSRRGVHALRIAAVSAAPVIVVPDSVTAGSGVVVGVDSGEISSRAAAFGAEEARRRGEPLTLVTAWELVPMAGYEFSAPMAVDDEFAGVAREVASAAAERVREGFPELDVRTSVVPGDPVAALVDAATDAALLVVGTHGRDGLARFLLGSVSHGVLAHLVAPTAVVR